MQVVSLFSFVSSCLVLPHFVLFYPGDSWPAAL